MKKSIIGTLLTCAVFTACQDDPMVVALQEKGIDVDEVSTIVCRSDLIQQFNVSMIK